MALGKLKTFALAGAALLASTAAEAGGKPCEEDIACSAGNGYTDRVAALIPTANEQQLNEALSTAVGDCRTKIAQALLDAGADKGYERFGISLSQKAEFQGCSTALKKILQN